MSHPPGHGALPNAPPATHTSVSAQTQAERKFVFILGGDGNWNTVVISRGNSGDKCSDLDFPPTYSHGSQNKISFTF